MADPGPPAQGSTTTAPPAPPPTSGSTSPSTTPGTATPPADTTPPPRAKGLKVNAAKPGQIVLTWKLVNPSDIAAVFVLRKPAGHCPTAPIKTKPSQHIGTRIGLFDRRTRQVDTTEHDRTSYCYAVFTLDVAGNWASPVTDRARNPGDITAPAVVTDVKAVLRQGGAVTLTWTNPSDAARVLVIRKLGSVCPSVPSDGQQVGSTLHRSSQVDTAAQPGSTYCYGVFAFDEAGNRSLVTTTTIATTQPSTQTTNATPPGQSGSSGSSLPDLVGIIGGGALVLAGLAYATLRVVRREWEWHSRTGYGIRDLMSVDVRDYDRTALVIPAIIGVCIAGALVVLLMSL